MVWGTSVVWGSSVVNGTPSSGEARLPWNNNRLSAFSVVWGSSTGTLPPRAWFGERQFEPQTPPSLMREMMSNSSRVRSKTKAIDESHEQYTADLRSALA